MSTDPTTIGPDESISAAIELMQNLKVRHLPVLNADDDLVGILSERDVSSWLVPYFRSPEQTEQLRKRANAPVSTIMTSAPVVIDMESDTRAAADLLIENQIGAVPVVDADGALVGMVSYVDLLRCYAQLEPESST